MLILRRTVRTSQPQYPVPIDWNKPITQGLSFGVLPKSAVEIIGNNPINYINSPGHLTANKGVGVFLNGSNQAISTGKKFITSEGSIYLLASDVDTSATSKCYASQSSTDSGDNIGLGWQGDKFRVGSVETTTAFSGTNISALGSWGSSGVRAYSDGVLTGANASIGSPASAAGNYYFEIGCFSYNGGRVFFKQESVLLFLKWDRALSAAEVKSIHYNPWQIFEDEEECRFIPAAGGTSTVSSDASAAYNVLGGLQSSATASYAIHSAIQSDSAASYSVRGSLQQSIVSDYVIRTSTQQNAASTYAVRGLVAQDVAPTYSIRGSVSSDTTAAYNILSATSVSASASAGYNIRGSINQDTAAIYALRGSVTQDTSATYSILSASAVSSSVTAGYAIKGSVQSSIVAGYSIDYASSGLIRAPSGSGPTVIQPGSYRPSQSATSRPSNAGGRRY